MRALIVAGAALLPGCGRRESPPEPAAGWIAEPIAAVRTSTLSAGPPDTVPPIENPYAEEAGALAEGRLLYQSFNCAGCHGGLGGGGIGPPLADQEWIYGGSDANIYATIVQGRPNGMPAFGPSLQGESAWKLAAYVRSLGEGAQAEGEEKRAGGQEREAGERGPGR